MKIISLFFISILAFNESNILAQEESYSLTLEQALEYALQHNKTLLNARGQVATSIERSREARAQGLPQVNGSLDFMTYFNYELNFSFGSSSGGSGEPLTFDEADETAFYNSLMGLFGPTEPIIMDNQLSGVLQFSQLIFSGQYWAGLQAAKIAQDLARQDVIRNEQDVKGTL
jgi:outer membrane protein TolC